MSAVAVLPTLSHLLAWPTEHLTEAADHWHTLSRHCYGISNQVWRGALSIDWQGDAAEAMRAATHADMVTTSAVTDQLEAAAAVARRAASDLYAARSRLRYAVDDAKAAGYEVREDLSVSDRLAGGAATQRVARQAQAQVLAGDINHRATQLVGLDQQVATRITAAMNGIRNALPQISPPSSGPSNNRVQAVDNHTFKRDPPLPVDPKNMTEAQARAAWAAINAEVAQFNARCGRTFVLPNEQGAYDACVADRGPLLERQAAIRARLEELGVPVEDGESPAAARDTPSAPPTRITGITEHGAARIDGRDGHGINDNALQDAVSNPIRPPQFIPDQYGGTWRYVGKDATVNLNQNGEVTTAWANNRNGWRKP
ncbi:hypothetical protein GAN17_15430 [Mycobacterium kubicae]|nr:hypothetical protein GAN17_15430 [Mycobacterium kubicae]